MRSSAAICWLIADCVYPSFALALTPVEPPEALSDRLERQEMAKLDADPAGGPFHALLRTLGGDRS